MGHWRKALYCRMIPVAEGLQALHDADIIHRDVKLSNLLVSEEQTWHLADFGIAVSQHHQRSGEVVEPAASWL